MTESEIKKQRRDRNNDGALRSMRRVEGAAKDGDKWEREIITGRGCALI